MTEQKNQKNIAGAEQACSCGYEETVGKVRSAYNAVCNEWNAFRKNCVINTCIEEFRPLLDRGCRVLDIGCGTGFPVAKYFSERGFRVTGMDVSEKMIEKANAQRLENAEFFVSEFMKFDASCKYGAAIAFDSLWHIPFVAQEKIYQKVSKLLECGGYFLFTHGRRESEMWGEMFGEKFYYSALGGEKLRRLLIDGGFDIIRYEEDYKEKTTGSRDLLVVVRKIRDKTPL